MSVPVTARDLITRSLRTLGACGQGETPSAADMEAGFQLLTELVDNWAIQALTVLSVGFAVYDIVSGQGGPTNPYTLGPGGDWDTGTAARPPSIQNATLLLNNSNPPVEIPLAILTDDMYAAQPTKTQTNDLPQWLYYNDTVPLGLIYLGNVPLNSANQIVLYTPTVTGAFPDLSSAYICPPGYLKAFRLCLSAAMISEFAIAPDIAARVAVDADVALAQLKASNFPMTDLSFDPALTPDLHGTYVIQTDQGA